MKHIVKLSITFKEGTEQEWVDKAMKNFSEMLQSTGKVESVDPVENIFDKIRLWALQKGIFLNGTANVQTLKLMEESGEVAAAVLRQKREDAIDGIGDCVVVLTSLAHFMNTTIEECIEAAYNEIKDRQGKMFGGDFQKDA